MVIRRFRWPRADGQGWQHRWTRWVAFICIFLLGTSVQVSCGATTGDATGGRAKNPATIWGLAGPYTGVNLSDAYRRGVRAVLVEASWAAAERSPGRFDHAYLEQLITQVRTYRSMGFKVALNYGLQDAPDWLMKLPGARFVNQYGTAYTDARVPDLIFNTTLRSFAQAYTKKILDLLGPLVYLVRVGGGYQGELDYPPPVSGEPVDQYWAYGPVAQRSAPEPGWRPCTRGRPGTARAFLTWYLASLLDYQQWQIQSVRNVYQGQIAILYPGVGFTAAQERQALSDNLCGRTVAEQAGAFARGLDQADQVSALSGPGLLPYSTGVDNPVDIDQLGQLAAQHHLQLAGENKGFNDAAEMKSAVQGARRWHLTSFFWIRAQQAYCHCNGLATIEDYQYDIGR